MYQKARCNMERWARFQNGRSLRCKDLAEETAELREKYNNLDQNAQILVVETERAAVLVEKWGTLMQKTFTAVTDITR